jgi:hypothetical protein
MRPPSRSSRRIPSSEMTFRLAFVFVVGLVISRGSPAKRGCPGSRGSSIGGRPAPSVAAVGAWVSRRVVKPSRECDNLHSRDSPPRRNRSGWRRRARRALRRRAGGGGYRSPSSSATRSVACAPTGRAFRRRRSCAQGRQCRVHVRPLPTLSGCAGGSRLGATSRSPITPNRSCEVAGGPRIYPAGRTQLPRRDRSCRGRWRSLHGRARRPCQPADPVVPPVPGVRELDGVWGTNELSRMKAVPRRLLVLGGGPARVELAHAVRHLGGEVALVARPSFVDLWHDLRAVSAEIRPDCNLAASGCVSAGKRASSRPSTPGTSRPSEPSSYPRSAERSRPTWSRPELDCRTT